MKKKQLKVNFVKAAGNEQVTVIKTEEDLRPKILHTIFEYIWEKKEFPKTSPYYQEARANATTSIIQVEKHIQEGLYSAEQFNNLMKKKCPDLIKSIRELNSNSEQN